MTDAYKLNGTKWRNRIVGYDNVAPDQLLANPLNFRRHPKNQQDALAGVLGDIGWLQDVIVNRTTEHVIDGHLRVELALRKGEPTVPVKYVELTEDEERLALATFDPLAAMAQVDAAALDALLASVNSGDAAVQAMLAELAQDAGLYGEKETVDAEPQIDRAEELRVKWDVHSGDLWQLGDHRLICGDCTDAAVVARVMGGERADMVWTDPPYGVDYEGGLNERKRTKLAGDESGDLYLPGLHALKSACAENAPMYVWFAASVGKPVYDAVEAIGYTVRAMIVWNKLNAHYGNFMAQYMQRHEPCLYIVCGNASWVGPTNEVTVWDVEQPSINEHHPTQKPTELASRAIRNHSAAIVADFFCGSGTTVIACEQLGRKCRAVEIAPGYVAVAIQRYFDATGREPVRVT